MILHILAELLFDCLMLLFLCFCIREMLRHT